MQIQCKQMKRADLVRVSGRIDGASAPELTDFLNKLMDEQRFHLVLDMSEVTYISSAGLRTLVSALKSCKRWNRGDLRLAALQPHVLEVLDMAGLSDLFKIYPDTTEAVGSF